MTENTPVKAKGFLLGEAMLAILITTVVIITLQMLLQSLRDAHRQSVHQTDVAYAYTQFYRFIHDDDVEKVVANLQGSSFKIASFKIKKATDEKIYYIEQYGNMIRVRGSKGGHMPLLLNIKGTSTSFSTNKDRIRIILTEKDGRVSYLYFKLDQEDDKDKDKEKDYDKEDKKGKSQRPT